MKFVDEFIGMFISSKCDKNCEHCLYDIAHADYKFDYELICEKVNKPQYKGVVISGGEPLMHPNVNGLVERIWQDFPNAIVLMRTNGKKLDSFAHTDSKRMRIEISEYPSWNDDIVKKYRDKPNVLIIPYMGFVKLEDIERAAYGNAQSQYDACVKFLWIKDNRAYECCGAMIPERRRKLKGVSVDMKEFSYDKLKDLNTLASCQTCMVNSDNFIQAQKSLRYEGAVEHW